MPPARKLRFEISRDDTDGFVSVSCTYPLNAISRALSSISEGQIAAVYGPEISEELAAYLADIGATRGDFAIGKRAYTISTLGAGSGISSKALSSIASFLRRDVPNSILDQSNDGEFPFIGLLDLDADSLFASIERAYLSSRRRARGTSSPELRKFLRFIAGSRLRGDLVLPVREYRPTLEQLLVLWIASKSTTRKTVLLGYGFERSNAFAGMIDKRLRRGYIPNKTLNEAAVSYFGLSAEAVSGAMSIWRATEQGTYGFHASSREGFTLGQCERFIEILSVGNVSTLPQDRVPKQLPAPLRFKAQAGRLSVLETKEHPENDPSVIGAAIACKSAASDLKDYGGFGNLLPNLNKKLDRITQALDQLIEDKYDDSLVIQLGVEVLALQQRLYDSQDEISEFGLKEAAAFFTTIQSFLAQFEIWSEYRVTAETRVGGNISGRAYSAAKETLTSLSADVAAASETSRDRINRYIVTLDDQDASPSNKQGAVTSLENAASAAAGDFLRVAKAQPGAVTKEIADKVRDKASSGAAAWLVSAAPRLLEFARERGLPWLQNLLQNIMQG